MAKNFSTGDEGAHSDAEIARLRVAAKPVIDWLADMEANGSRPGGDHELACLRGMWPDSKFFTFGDVRALRDALEQ